ncbi:MAG: TldD/PmbA family protein [Armatimonadota bacterium]|nr:TldD/PmbA family protein [Armatimonadota bacterium]
MDYVSFAQDVVKQAIRAGAHEVDVYIQTGDDFEVEVRLGEIEELTQASSKGLGLRVFVDKRMAFASTTDLHMPVVSDLIKTTVQLAKAANKDKYNGLPDVGPGAVPDLKLFDPALAALPIDERIRMAREAEKASFEFDPRVTSSYGAGFEAYSGNRVLANSNGIAYTYSSTHCSISVAPVAEEDGKKQIGGAYSSRRFLAELASPEEVGREAAQKAVEKLGARKVETQKVPVVFDRMVGPDLWGPIFSALDGDSVHKGISFLKKKLGKRIASPVVCVVDDPLMPGGVGSMPFDGEGILTSRKIVIENGVLQMYFYDTRTARKYGKQPTGNTRRGYSGTPHISPSNFYLQPGEKSRDEIIRGIKKGFYVTDTIGRGANIVTGDFSVGATGIWISDGELAFPVQEVTIAGNMLEMMLNIEEVANDIRFISNIASPTFKIAEMMVAGR